MSIRYARIPERPSTAGGGRLGRHVRHDDRSRRYALPASGRELVSVRHVRSAPILDQGEVGCCTAAAMVGALACPPFYPTLPSTVLDLDLALELYSLATTLDAVDGCWPPEDTGSDGLSACKAAKTRGLVSGYRWAFGLDAALDALMDGPVLLGVTWWSSFDTPRENGMVTRTPGAVPRGGHEVVVDQLDVLHHVVGCTNSWGLEWGVGGRFYLGWDLLESLLDDSGDVAVPVPVTVPGPLPEPVRRRPLGSCLVDVGREIVAGLRWRTPRG